MSESWSLHEFRNFSLRALAQVANIGRRQLAAPGRQLIEYKKIFLSKIHFLYISTCRNNLLEQNQQHSFLNANLSNIQLAPTTNLEPT